MLWNGRPGCPLPQNSAVQDWDILLKNYTLFMIPKPLPARLSISMEFSNANARTWPQPYPLAAFGTQAKELNLKLSLEIRNRGDVMIVHCQGRILVAPGCRNPRKRQQSRARSRRCQLHRQRRPRRIGFPLHLGTIPERRPEVCQSQSTRARTSGSYEPGFSPRNSPQRARSSSGLPAR